MPRGRPPLPASVKKLRGNPGKRKIKPDLAPPMKGVAQPTAADVATLPVPSPPDYFSEIAAQEWNRLAKLMVNQGTLRELDRTAFEVRCLAYERLIKARKQSKGKLIYTARNGTIRPHPLVKVMEQAERTIRQFDGEYGLTPASRVRVSHITGDLPRRPQQELPLGDPNRLPATTESQPAPQGETAPQPLSDDAFFAGPGSTRH
jgi:P27 family predicted phage terminase small subunit